MDGEIHLFDFSGGKGREETYSRPAIILKAITEYGLLVVLPLTSKINKNMPFTYFIRKTPENGLKEDSLVLLGHIKSIDPSRLLSGSFGKLNEQDMNNMKAIIRDMLEL